MTQPRRLSISGLADYRKCPALWWFDHVSGIKVDDPSTLDQQRGHVFHHGIARALIDGRIEGVMEYACAEALIYATAKDVPADVTDQAIKALAYHIPRLGINTKMKAYQYNRKPMVEFSFDVAYGVKPDEVRLRGTVDAVVMLEDGRVMLLDWKFRKQHYDAKDIRMDKQLYVYAAVLQQIYGVPLDGAAQVQVLAETPAHMTLLNDKTGTSARDYTRSMSKTTSEQLQVDIAHLPDEVRAGIYRRFSDKVAPDSHFLNFAKLNLKHAQTVLNIVLQQIHEINHDQHFLPTLDAYTCKSCIWQAHCHTRTFKMGEG